MEKKILTPDEVCNDYDEISKAYQEAFAGDPWYEKSKCIDPSMRCIGGLSSVAIGEVCKVCEISPVQLAYENSELYDRFNSLAAEKNVAWYIERYRGALALAACSWKSNAIDLAKDRYLDNSNMKKWLQDRFEDTTFTYLDEIFAQKSIRPTGNLWNFKNIVTGLTRRLGTEQICFRTINQALIRAAERDFKNVTTRYLKNINVPDRRDFVIIDVGECQQ